jgi:hypothetical protein
MPLAGTVVRLVLGAAVHVVRSTNKHTSTFAHSQAITASKPKQQTGSAQKVQRYLWDYSCALPCLARLASWCCSLQAQWHRESVMRAVMYCTGAAVRWLHKFERGIWRTREYTTISASGARYSCVHASVFLLAIAYAYAFSLMITGFV